MDDLHIGYKNNSLKKKKKKLTKEWALQFSKHLNLKMFFWNILGNQQLFDFDFVQKPKTQ
jgi:hypothetical protein